jgi:hypothetical protein
MGVRVSGDPALLAPRVRSIAANLDAGLRLDEVRSLDDLAWNVDVPMMVAAGAIVGVKAWLVNREVVAVPGIDPVAVDVGNRDADVRAAIGNDRHGRATDIARADAQNSGREIHTVARSFLLTGVSVSNGAS